MAYILSCWLASVGASLHATGPGCCGKALLDLCRRRKESTFAGGDRQRPAESPWQTPSGAFLNHQYGPSFRPYRTLAGLRSSVGSTACPLHPSRGWERSGIPVLSTSGSSSGSEAAVSLASLCGSSSVR